MAQAFTLEFTVRDYELDQYGVVNNAVYLNYLEHTRHEFLHTIAIDPAAVAASGQALALSEIQVRFRSPLRSRERFRSELCIGAVRGARVVIEQRLVAMDDAREVLTAQAVAVFLDEGGRPRRVTPEHRAAFGAFQQAVPAE